MESDPNYPVAVRAYSERAARIFKGIEGQIPGIEGQIPINAAAFSKMKTNAVIVNVARGAIIEEAALYAALKSKRIAGAVIDTWYYCPKQGEDPCTPSKLPFRELDKLIITPHASAWTNNLTLRRCQAIADDLNRLARGEPLTNIVKQGHS